MGEKLTQLSPKKAAFLLCGLAVVLLAVMIIPLLFSKTTTQTSHIIPSPALDRAHLPTAVPSVNLTNQIISPFLSIPYPQGWTYKKNTVQGGGEQYNIYPINKKTQYDQVFIEVSPHSAVSLTTKNTGLSHAAKSRVKTQKFEQEVTQFRLEYKPGEVTQSQVYEQYYTFEYKGNIYVAGYKYESPTQDISREAGFESILNTLKLP